MGGLAKDRKPTKFFLVLDEQKSSRSSEQKSNLNHKNRESQPSINYQSGANFQTQSPLNEEEAGSA